MSPDDPGGDAGEVADRDVGGVGLVAERDDDRDPDDDRGEDRDRDAPGPVRRHRVGGEQRAEHQWRVRQLDGPVPSGGAECREGHDDGRTAPPDERDELRGEQCPPEAGHRDAVVLLIGDDDRDERDHGDDDGQRQVDQERREPPATLDQAVDAGHTRTVPVLGFPVVRPRYDAWPWARAAL